eukprot:g3803.t1
MTGALFFSGAVARGEDSAERKRGKGTGEIEERLEWITGELAGLSHPSLNTGVGAVGFRTVSRDVPDSTEWMEVDLGAEFQVDEVILVPTFWRAEELGFVPDAFPEEFRVMVNRGGGAGWEEASTYREDKSKPAGLTPVVIRLGGQAALRVRIEVDRLPRRFYDGRYLLQFSELMVFCDGVNRALHQPVSGSSGNEDSQAWNRGALVDGVLPFLMNSAHGGRSLAYISPTVGPDRPAVTIDLGEKTEVSGLVLHAVDQSDTVPPTNAGDFGVPRGFRLEGAMEEDFSDAVVLLEKRVETIFEMGPFMPWNFPAVSCRYVRLTAVDPYISKYRSFGPRMGFAEIELLSGGRNVAKGRPVTVNFDAVPARSRLDRLTDGRNLYGDILPVREWLLELERRHELESEEVLLRQELGERYARQKLYLRWGGGVLVCCAAGIGIMIPYHRISVLRREMSTRQRIAANLHDELGANLHAIGMLGDVAERSLGSPERLAEAVRRIRGLTERTGEAARHCTNMLEAGTIRGDLVEELRRDADRLLMDHTYELCVTGGELLEYLPRRRRIDLYLFHKECLTNITRHAGATEVEIRLVVERNMIALCVRDNGCGVGAKVPKALQRRAKLMGGVASTGSEEEEPGLEVVCRYGSAEFALNEIRDMRGRNLPDLVLLDLQLSGKDGLEALPHFLTSIPGAKVIILTQSERPEDVLRAIARGSSGYLLKSATIDEVVEGIHAVMAGGASLDPVVAGFILKKLETTIPRDEEGTFLTKRELAVLELLAEGLVKKEIAEEMGIGYPAVDNHIRSIYRKLDAAPEKKVFYGMTFHVLRVPAHAVRIVWKDDSGKLLRTVPAASRYFKGQGLAVEGLMNGGIFEPGGIPSGLLVQDGKELRPVNLDDGYGNFFLKPNGIFLVSSKGAAVIKTTEYPLRDVEVRYAVQSGPLLLRAGKIHPVFKKGSKSRLHRNGVGVDGEGNVVLAISDLASERFPNLYEFAALFRSLGCEDALFLDGDISQLRCGEGMEKDSNQFGSMIAILKKESE